jgi:hypothetical protein
MHCRRNVIAVPLDAASIPWNVYFTSQSALPAGASGSLRVPLNFGSPINDGWSNSYGMPSLWYRFIAAADGVVFFSATRELRAAGGQGSLSVVVVRQSAASDGSWRQAPPGRDDWQASVFCSTHVDSSESVGAFADVCVPMVVTKGEALAIRVAVTNNRLSPVRLSWVTSGKHSHTLQPTLHFPVCCHSCTIMLYGLRITMAVLASSCPLTEQPDQPTMTSRVESLWSSPARPSQQAWQTAM